MMPPAMVLAAGLGTRMRPLTDALPKPLIPVAGVPLIDRALDWLAASGVTQAVVNSHYKAEMLAAHLAARSGLSTPSPVGGGSMVEKTTSGCRFLTIEGWGHNLAKPAQNYAPLLTSPLRGEEMIGRRYPDICISHEPTLLETGGGILKALPMLGEGAFFNLNSDVICLDGAQPALQRLLDSWDEETMDALLLLHPIDKAVGYDGAGDFFLGEGGALRRRMAAPSAPFVFTGVQLMHPRLFAGAPGGAFSLNLLYNRGMAADGMLARIRGLAHDGAWLHVGDPQGLKIAEEWLKRHDAR